MYLLMAFFALFALSYANGLWLLCHLRTVHPEVWAHLGQPSLMQTNLATPRLRLMKFVWSQQFRSLNDKALSRSCGLAMAAEIALVLTFAAFIAGAI